MEFSSLEKRNRIKYTLEQINTALDQLKEWNEDVKTANDFYLSSSPSLRRWQDTPKKYSQKLAPPFSSR